MTVRTLFLNLLNLVFCDSGFQHAVITALPNNSSAARWSCHRKNLFLSSHEAISQTLKPLVWTQGLCLRCVLAALPYWGRSFRNHRRRSTVAGQTASSRIPSLSMPHSIVPYSLEHVSAGSGNQVLGVPSASSCVHAAGSGWHPTNAEYTAPPCWRLRAIPPNAQRDSS